MERHDDLNQEEEVDYPVDEALGNVWFIVYKKCQLVWRQAANQKKDRGYKYVEDALPLVLGVNNAFGQSSVTEKLFLE